MNHRRNTQGPFPNLAILACAATLLLHAAATAFAAETSEQLFTLKNDLIAVEISPRGLTSIRDLALDKRVDYAGYGSRVILEKKTADEHEHYIETAGMKPLDIRQEGSTLTFSYQPADDIDFKVIYELKPDWRFVTIQIVFDHKNQPLSHVKEINLFAGRIITQAAFETRVERTGVWAGFHRYARTKDSEPDYGAFYMLQNPLGKWYMMYDGTNLGYTPDMDWKAEYGPFVSDKACIGIYPLSGVMSPSRGISESLYLRNPQQALDWSEKLDMAEIQAARDCVSKFMTWKPQKSIRMDVGWCNNDYQIDTGTPEGSTEYKRIIDRAAAMGCQYMLYSPSNSAVSSRELSRDAWGWEHVLWLGLGEKIREDKWDPETDPIPPSVQEMLDYAKSKNVGLVAYVYPTLPWLQQPEWTAWIKGGPGGYQGPDHSIRTWQDFLIRKLVAFQKKTGIQGYSFDLWYVNSTGSSPYAQWHGVRRILDELQRQVPGILIDGRQTLAGFGPWTATSGCYPHPFGWDEQPGSFGATADLHTDRISANHARSSNWSFAMRSLFPIEVIPGYMTHQTQRGNAEGKVPYEKFRVRDWDYLGWKYSVISSISTAPQIHILNLLPARDEDEYKNFSQADMAWTRRWLDWTDTERETLRHIRPVLGPPIIGRTDGSAAFKGERGFLFLFNPNYRQMDATIKLDHSIGLNAGERYVITQLYPREGLLIGKPNEGVWRRGDDFTLPMDGASAVVLKVEPASTLQLPALFNAPGKAEFANGQLTLSDVSGAIGTEQKLLVLPPVGDQVRAVTINGKAAPMTQTGAAVAVDARFAGEPFGPCQRIGAYDGNFEGGCAVQGEFSVPQRILDQLAARQKAWPIPYTQDDLIAPWLAPHRLLLFVNIAGAKSDMKIGLKLNGQPLEVRQAWNGLYPNVGERTFIGFYADLSDIRADTKYHLEAELPPLGQGQFQGLFFENIETEYTRELK